MINNNPGGRLWVDPDGVEGLGLAYQDHVQLYNSYLSQLTALRSRYANAWGDDDMGEQFSTKFLEGIDNLEAIIGGVKGTLAFTAEGLTQSGRAYREADEAAAEVGHKMDRNFESLDRPSLAFSAADSTRTPLQPTYAVGHAVAKRKDEPGTTPLEPTYAVGHAVAQRIDEPGTTPLQPRAMGERMRGEVVDAEMEPDKPVFMRAMTAQERALEPESGYARGQLAEKTELLPTERASLPAERRPLVEATESGFTPLEPTLAYESIQAQPLMPAISSMRMEPEYMTAHVGGQALPPGYRLISLNTFEDGSSRVDANLYDSVTPLAGATVTTPEGAVIDPRGNQLFVVKENPNADPTAPGYEPLVMSYAPDGTPTPIFPGF